MDEAEIQWPVFNVLYIIDNTEGIPRVQAAVAKEDGRFIVVRRDEYTLPWLRSYVVPGSFDTAYEAEAEARRRYPFGPIPWNMMVLYRDEDSQRMLRDRNHRERYLGEVSPLFK